MAIVATNDAARAALDSDDISIVPNIDLENPLHLNAFDALGRAKRPV
jgi:hypothetical protein